MPDVPRARYLHCPSSSDAVLERSWTNVLSSDFVNTSVHALQLGKQAIKVRRQLAVELQLVTQHRVQEAQRLGMQRWPVKVLQKLHNPALPAAEHCISGGYTAPDKPAEPDACLGTSEADRRVAMLNPAPPYVASPSRGQPMCLACTLQSAAAK